jgi:aspartyl-tRNA(Asn)/glutamyl-tRNA(Gln) amidotransferase subunit A
MEIISGYDPKDSTSAKVDVPKFSEELEREVKGLKVGIPKEFFEFEMEEGVKECFDNFVKFYEWLGFEIEEISLPHSKYAIPTYYIIAPCEASSNLARYDGVRYGL